MPSVRYPNPPPKQLRSGAIVVQKLRRSFILPHANMAMVRCNGHNAIVAHLMYVLRCSEYARIHFSHSLRIFELIAGVMKRGQAELILRPFAEIARAVSLLLIGSRSRSGRFLRS